MYILKQVKAIENHLNRAKKAGKKIGFIPTMGALHSGHISLIKASKRVADVTVCSIFVNPTQFNDKHDFEKYPSTIDKDVEMLADAGCDVLFLPPVKEIYPNGFKNPAKINFGFIAEILEGRFRPGHFDGMAQVVEKLLRIVKPDLLFMGQKDYQQQLIVRRLIQKRRFKTKLVMCPITREKSGLAMSSRNMRLDRKALNLAAEISRTLKNVKARIKNANVTIKDLQVEAFNRLRSFKEIEPEYFEIRNALTLKPPKKKSEKLVALVAAEIGGVRLIDNMLLT